MNFKKIELLSYGKLINESVNLESGINLIYGKNESGKTTIMKSIFDIIYGIYPTNKEKNELVNWDNNKLELKALISNDNKEYTIYRRLESSPKGSLVVGNDIKVINNDTLEFAKNIPRYLYKELYYLNSKLLNKLNEKTWKKIDNKVIFSYGDTIIRNPDEVMDEIDEKLSQIWRNTNRGNFRIKLINQELNSLNKKKNALIKKYNETKFDVKEMNGLEISISAKELELKAKLDLRDKIERLLPIANLLTKIDQLEKSYNQYSIYRSINPEILQEINILEEKKKTINERIEEIEDEIKNNELKLNQYNKKELLVEENIDKITLTLQLYDKLLKEKDKLFESQNREKIIFEDYKKLYYKIFNEIYTDDKFELVKNIKKSDLNKKQIDKNKIFLSGGSIILGCLAYYFDFFLLSLVFLTTGISFGLDMFKNSIIDLKELKNVKINDELLRNFYNLKTLEFKILELEEENKKIKGKLMYEEEKVKENLKKYNEIENLDFNVKVIRKMIKDILQKRTSDDKFIFIIKKLRHNRKSYQNKELEILNELEYKKESLMALGYESLDANINYFNRNKDIDNKIKNLREELELIENNSLLIKEYSNTDRVINNLELDKINQKIDKLKDIISKNKVEFTKLQGSIEKNAIDNEISEVETDIEMLKLERKSLNREKNNLIFMRELIKKSNKEFKEENQPGIIKEVNKLFNFFTDDKYDRIYIDENTKEIYIQLDRFNKKIEEGFSSGTVDQLFLALKLALIKHYEKGFKLPIILDEVFANWDNSRMQSFINSLKTIISDRQLIILTCKEEVLKAFERVDDLNLKVIRIDGVTDE